MGLSDTTNPVIGEMTVRITSGSQAVEFERFEDYTYKENYLDASDTFSFTLAQKEFTKRDLSVIVPGAIVEPCVNGHPQSRGILDEPQATFSRGEGNVVRCESRDWFSNIIDAQVDPQTRFVPSMSLLDLVFDAYSPFIPNLTVFADSVSNRNVITGTASGLTPGAPGRSSSASDKLQQAQAAFAQRYKSKKNGAPTKHFILGEEKPYANEGLFTFTSRVAQRFGLWIRPFVDGESIVLAAPDFTQAPRYGLCHALFGPNVLKNNVEKGTFIKSRKDQPSIIYASGAGGGGNFAHSQLRAGIVNLAVQADNSKILAAYPGVPLVEIDPITAAFPPIVESAARPAFLYDPESHTQDQLEAFLRRELSLRMRKAVTARYEFMGHVLNGQPVAVDTIVSVLDQQPLADWDGPLWVLGREYRKNARDGARTTLELIIPGSLQF